MTDPSDIFGCDGVGCDFDGEFDGLDDDSFGARRAPPGTAKLRQLGTRLKKIDRALGTAQRRLAHTENAAARLHAGISRLAERREMVNAALAAEQQRRFRLDPESSPWALAQQEMASVAGFGASLPGENVTVGSFYGIDPSADDPLSTFGDDSSVADAIGEFEGEGEVDEFGRRCRRGRR